MFFESSYIIQEHVPDRLRNCTGEQNIFFRILSQDKEFPAFAALRCFLNVQMYNSALRVLNEKKKFVTNIDKEDRSAKMTRQRNNMHR